MEHAILDIFSYPKLSKFPYQGKTALITGASSGIGAAFARELATRGMHLILVARSLEQLQQLANKLSQQYSVQVHAIPVDLSQPDAARQVKAAVVEHALEVHLLINNAGFGTYNHFECIDAGRDHQQVMVNVAAVVDLAHAFLPDMLKRGEGAMINVASRSAFQPTPYFAVYAASKAFVLSFSEALSVEYRHRGIRVLAVCPGPVDTNFFKVAGGQRRGAGTKASPDSVVTATLKALERGKSVVIPGWSIWLSSQVASRLLPRSLSTRLVEWVTRPR
jgi:short-subunit dehydrogenase